MKINLYIEIITHASYNIKRYYDVQGLCIKDIWKSEVDEMKKKPETGVQRAKRYRRLCFWGIRLLNPFWIFACFGKTMWWQTGAAALTIFREICCLLFPCSRL